MALHPCFARERAWRPSPHRPVYVYKAAIAGLANANIFADLNGKIWSLTESPANSWTRTQLLSTGRTISSFGHDSAGEIYVVDFSGNVLKLVAQ